LKGMR